MQNLPSELVQEILNKQDDIKDITQLCESSSRNKNICENFFIHKIKSEFKTSAHIFAGLFLRFNITEIRYAGKTRLRNDSLIIKSHKVMYSKNTFMKKLKFLLTEWIKYDGNAGIQFPNRPFDPNENIDNYNEDENYNFSLKNDGENLFLQIQGNNCYRLILSTPNNELYEKIINDYLSSKFEEGDELFNPTNPNRGSFPPELT